MINWKDLIVTDAEGGTVGTLGEEVEAAGNSLRNIWFEDGKLVEWPQFFVSAPGEEPGPDSPREAVDWTGFSEALAAAVNLD